MCARGWRERNSKRLVVLLVLELAGGSKGNDNDDRGKDYGADNRDDRDGHGVPEALLRARLADNTHRLDVPEDARALAAARFVRSRSDCRTKKCHSVRYMCVGVDGIVVHGANG